MFTFLVLLLLINDADQTELVTYRSVPYSTYVQCEQARKTKMFQIAKRTDVNWLFMEPCSMKL